MLYHLVFTLLAGPVTAGQRCIAGVHAPLAAITHLGYNSPPSTASSLTVLNVLQQLWENALV